MVQLILITYNLESFFLCFLANYFLLAEKKNGPIELSDNILEPVSFSLS